MLVTLASSADMVVDVDVDCGRAAVLGGREVGGTVDCTCTAGPPNTLPCTPPEMPNVVTKTFISMTKLPPYQAISEMTSLLYR